MRKKMVVAEWHAVIAGCGAAAVMSGEKRQLFVSGITMSVGDRLQLGIVPTNSVPTHYKTVTITRVQRLVIILWYCQMDSATIEAWVDGRQIGSEEFDEIVKKEGPSTALRTIQLMADNERFEDGIFVGQSIEW